MDESGLNPAHELRKKEAAYQQRRQNKAKPKKESYERIGNKVVKITKTSDGNIYSTYVGRFDKCKDLLEK